MRKIWLLLTVFISICIFTPNVKAASFHEGEYINGMYMNKVKGNTVYYQKGRTFREDGSNKIAYCIEPFTMFNEQGDYNPTLDPNYLSDYQKLRISLLAHFGYGYYTRDDLSWYGVTQLMIWQVADPSGEYYFTNGLNGPKTNYYDSYINELNQFIDHYIKEPSFHNQTFNIVEGQELILPDYNKVIHYYQSSDPNIEIYDNHLIIRNLKENSYTFELKKEDNYFQTPLLFYTNHSSQDLVSYGDIYNLSSMIKVNVKRTKVEIEKIDADTKSTTASGQGILQGASYELYNEKMERINTLTIGQEFRSILENLPFGKYYLKEIKAGIGYELDPNTYEFNLSIDNLSVFLQLENKIIKEKIEIYKEYGDGNDSRKEANIIFDIFDIAGNYITSIITDENGYASTILPYGKYTLKQRNTSDGYNKVDDFEIIVDKDNNLSFSLYDYKIKVPNTLIEEQNIMLLPFIIISIGGVYYKKRKNS